jgi:iron complex transport system permease protein
MAPSRTTEDSKTGPPDSPPPRDGTTSPPVPAPAPLPGEVLRGPRLARWRRRTVLGLLVVVLLIAFVANLGAGAVSIPPGEVLDILLRHAGLTDGDAHRFDAVVWQIRLPRAVLAALVGAALAVAGAGLQAVFRNPLAEPRVIGVANGAAVGAVATIVFGIEVVGIYTVPLAAFLTALVTTAVVLGVATQGNRTEVVTLLLAGIAVEVTAAAATGLLIYWADDEQVRDIVFWTLGSLAGSTWTQVAAITPPVVVAAVALCALARDMDLLALGDREAGHLGAHPHRVRVIAVVLAALATGAAVAVAGVIGFVGLIVPHIVRMTVGPEHRRLLPASALGGAALLLGADLAARTLVIPSELPLGVVTALAGGPYFLWLIRSQRTADGGWA